MAAIKSKAAGQSKSRGREMLILAGILVPIVIQHLIDRSYHIAVILDTNASTAFSKSRISRNEQGESLV
ncbi:MAG: hypothetical protein QME21_08375, partial [Anaerolineales bacterium]|nr:hypothetical protein [Anaerolineales bacterium]